MAAGDGLVRPLNAPPGQQTPVGVQPGTTTGVVVANKILIIGPNGGLFAYAGNPALGNPPILWSSEGPQDPFGNVLPFTGTGVKNGSLLAGITSQATVVVGAVGEVSFGTLGDSGSGITSLTSSTTGVADAVAEIDLQSKNGNGTGSAVVVTATKITLANGSGASSIGINAANGHPVFSEEIELSQTATPGAPGSGVKVWSDASGILRAVGTDTSVLAVGTQTDMFTGTMLVSVNGFTTLTDGTNTLSVAVGVNRKYKVRARVIYQATSGVVGTPTFTVASAAGNGGLTYDFDFNGNASGICRYDNASGFGSSEAGPAHATAGAATFVTLDITGTVSMTAGGTIAVQASIGGAGNSTFTIQKGSFLEVGPI